MFQARDIGMRIEEWKVRIPQYMLNMLFVEAIHKYFLLDAKHWEYPLRPDYLEMDSWSGLSKFFFDEFKADDDQRSFQMERGIDHRGLRRREDYRTW